MTRITRRRFIRGAAMGGAGLALASVAGCGEGKRRAVPTAGPTETRTPATATTRGGTLRTYNFDALIPDTLDPHLTQFGPVVNMHSAVFSKLLRYDDERAGTISPDLAEAMPEQPDELTYIFRLRDGVTFHDAPHFRLAQPNVAGRALDSSDVKFSIERQINRNAPNARRLFRSSQLGVIDRIDTPDARTVIMHLKAPTAPFLSFIAGRHSFVVARECVSARTHDMNNPLAMIGTGPFFLEQFDPTVGMRIARNPMWFARHDVGEGTRPYLDAYQAYYSPQNDEFQREAFERRLVDSTSFADPAALEHTRTTNLADIVLEEQDAGGMLVSRFLVDRAPFRDGRVRRAIHLAIDRAALGELLYPPMAGESSAKLSGPIAPAFDRWSIAPEDLLQRPGYGAARDDDIAEAKQLWNAAMGDRPVTDLPVFFQGVPKNIPEVGLAVVQRQLKDVLGLNIVPQVDPSGHAVIGAALVRNLEGATEGVAPFTFMWEDGGVDLDDWLYPHFRSGESQNTYRLQDSTLDALLDDSRREFDTEAREALGRDIQDYLLAKVNARIEYVAPIERRLTWGYVRNAGLTPGIGSDFKLADAWLDAEHPGWSGRPAGTAA